MVSVFACEADRPGSSPARSVFISQTRGDLPACYKLVPTKMVHVLSCLCDNACKRYLDICRKNTALCPVSRLLSIRLWPACAKQGR